MNISKLALVTIGVAVGISVCKCVNEKNKKIEKLSCQSNCFKCSYQRYSRCKK